MTCPTSMYPLQKAYAKLTTQKSYVSKKSHKNNAPTNQEHRKSSTYPY